MLKLPSREQTHRQYVGSVRVAATLLEGPRTFEEIAERSYGYLRPLGLFRITERQACNQVASVRKRLDALVAREWIVHEGEHYALTPLGRTQVHERLAQLGETGSSIRGLLRPQTVSKVTVGVHWALAALKLPAALLSGSVGLLNDATDTLLDGVSSLLVYFGLRFEKERAVNVVLVVLMLGTGALTLYEAARRFLIPSEPEVDWFAFLAALVSAAVCLGLWAYQRYVGLQSGIMALITQSVDSRNHVIVAVSVTAGLLAALLRFPLLDTLVGLGVAVLILKSAIELAVETARSLGEQEVDLSRFGFGLGAPFHRFVQGQLRDWMLYLVAKQGVETRSELVARASRALDFNQVPAVRAMALAHGQPQADELIEQGLSELFERGWLTGDERVTITDRGRKHLDAWM
jgi:hypothetical protein